MSAQKVRGAAASRFVELLDRRAVEVYRADRASAAVATAGCVLAERPR